MRNVPEMLLCSFQWQFELEDLHDSIFVGFIWLLLPLAARQQEPLDSRNPHHPALEGLEGKTKSHIKTQAFNHGCLGIASCMSLHIYLRVGKVLHDSGEQFLQHQGALKQQHICHAEFTSHQVDGSSESLFERPLSCLVIMH